MDPECRGNRCPKVSSCTKVRPIQGWAFANSSAASATKTTKNQGWAFGPTTPVSPGSAASDTAELSS